MTRRRTGQAGFDTIQPDPSHIGGVAEAPFARLPDPATLFANRARRLAALAQDHVLADYLNFLASVARAQAASVRVPTPVPPEQATQRAAHGFPPIAADQVRADPDLVRTFDDLLAALELDSAPDAVHQAVDALRALPPDRRADLAADIFEGGTPLDRMAEALFAAAALQVHLAGLATQLDPAALQPPAEGVCPACGGPPVASVVVGWTQASKARYCACSLCGTLWNHVRIKCTACAATDGITYHGIEQAPGPVGIEACTTCNTYIKHMQQHEDPNLDPIADDVASYALDLLAREQGFRRSGVNPLFLTA